MVVSRGTISKFWGSRGAFFPAVDGAADRAGFFAWARFRETAFFTAACFRADFFFTAWWIEPHFSYDTRKVHVFTANLHQKPPFARYLCDIRYIMSHSRVTWRQERKSASLSTRKDYSFLKSSRTKYGITILQRHVRPGNSQAVLA